LVFGVERINVLKKCIGNKKSIAQKKKNPTGAITLKWRSHHKQEVRCEKLNLEKQN
jgi:hypothetical protein